MIKKESNTTVTVGRSPVQQAAYVFLKVILFLILFVVLLFLLLLTPPVQKFATSRVEVFLENKLKTNVDIGRISVGLPRAVALYDVYIEDQTKDTLLSGGTIKADLNIYKLLFANEVEIKDLQFRDMTAKFKRALPDTVFNFQFVVDAFKPKKTSDTTTTAQLKMALDHLALDNVRMVYNDVLTGDDLVAHVSQLRATIDTLNPYTSNYSVPSLVINGMRARMYQRKPLVEPETVSKDITEAAKPIPLKLNFGVVNLENVLFDYGNDVSAFYTRLAFGNFSVKGRQLDLQNRTIHLASFNSDNTLSAIRLGKKEQAKVLEREVEKEVAVQKQQDWIFRIDEVNINNNIFQFDNDNQQKQSYGIDYAHMRADSLTLHMKNFVLNTDTVAALITKGNFKERSGFILEALEGDILYAQNGAHLKDLYIKTPGTVLRRNLTLEYASYDALMKHFDRTIFDADITDSRVQVKDILAFAPQLRNHPAFANRNAIWRINIDGSGNMNRMHFNTLQFDGLKNTSIDASGTLAGLNDPNTAGGTFTIRKLHTSQTDISLFTGKRLSTKDVNFPETFSARGTLSGNISRLNTNLTIATAYGNATVNGTLANLTNPSKFSYNAFVSTRGLRLDLFMRNKVPVGALSANMRLSGYGTTPETMNTKFNGTIYSIRYDGYTYRNLKLNGNIKQSAFFVDADVRDPNIDLQGTISGRLAANSAFKVNVFVDSIRTMPLGLTTTPMLFHGKLVADITSLNPDYLEGDVTITDALFVTNNERLPVDSMHFVSGRTASGQFMRLTSPMANAEIEGTYRIADLGYIIQNNIAPYFAVSSDYKVYNVKPYDFTFRADVVNSPFISAFVPGLVVVEPLHAEGSLASGKGLNATIQTGGLLYQKSTLENVNVTVTTTPEGLQFNGTIGHLVTSKTLDVYNTSLVATAKNNVINFKLDVNDKADKDKYNIAGVLRQPRRGTYALHLNPGGLLLNYEGWTTSADNELIITPDGIIANNFSLSKGDQAITLQSPSGAAGPLDVRFKDFQIATITGFLRADTILASGVLNGTASFRDLTKNPLFTSDITVTDFAFRQDTIGNVILKVRNTNANTYIADANITGRGNDIDLAGTLNLLANNEVGLDLRANVRQMQLNTFEGALKDFVTRADGIIKGAVDIKGTLSSPDVQGSLTFEDAKFSTVMLGGEFTIDDETLTVGNNGFRFNNFSIRDSANNALTINGNVRTSNFLNYNFNLDVNANNFRILHTNKKQNKIYWGQVYISTTMHIEGTEQSPILDGSLTVEDRTDLTVVIPQREPGIVEREGVIQFVDMNAAKSDSLFLADYKELNKSSLVGYNLSANIEIKKEAKVSLVIDAANGDLLNLQGEALLTAGVDPSGKITLTGSYVLDKGAYELSLNFIRRKFEIQKGSTIVWLGEPTRAELNVTGLYIANAAPVDLVQGQLSAATGSLRQTYFLQKLPFEVYVKVTGEMMKPIVNFDIILPPEKSYTVSKDVIQMVESRLEQIRQEPSEINKQVFALLLLNRFVGDNPFHSEGAGFSAGSFARQSVSQIFSDQLNALAGGLVAGVDLNFNVISSDDYTTGALERRTDLNVGVTKRLLDDRLTVSIGSNFELDGPNNSNQRSGNLAGDVSINYKLSKDGRYMLRFYRKNEFQGVIEGYIIETGLGFSLNVDYDKFREVLRGRKIPLEGVDDKQKSLSDVGQK